MHCDFRFALFRGQYKGSIYWAGSSISSRISRYINLKLTFSIYSFRALYWCSHSVISIYTKLSKPIAFNKISSFYCFIRLVSHLRYLYRFYLSRATRTKSVCNEMYHNVFRYEYLTFQTQFHLHTQKKTSLIQILFKVNMRFFFLSIYIVPCNNVLASSSRLRW